MIIEIVEVGFTIAACAIFIAYLYKLEHKQKDSELNKRLKYLEDNNVIPF